MDALLTFVSAALVNNVVLTQFLGLCPFMGTSRQLPAALGMAAATLFVLTCASGVTWLVWSLVLVPFDLEYLRLITFIFVIAALVQFTETLIQHDQPQLDRSLGIYLPLITTNCAILGVCLGNVREPASLLDATWTGFAAAAGFGFVLVAFTLCRQRLDNVAVPGAFRGPPIQMITIGLAALGFMGLTGLAG